MNGLGYHGTALGAALGIGAICGIVAAGLSSLELRGGLMQMQSTGELWLLCVFTAGVLAILLGLSTLIGGWPGSGTLRDRLDAFLGPDRGRGNDEPHERSTGRGNVGRAGAWMIEVGGGLLGLYLVGWMIG
ncbi:MAG: hypothetical protein EA351_11520 [Gemmatimonadales bacterium]|nr:MAG: hypothetical protein EA351_11520 [Gemmatimonadales bacterium]